MITRQSANKHYGFFIDVLKIKPEKLIKVAIVSLPSYYLTHKLLILQLFDTFTQGTYFVFEAVQNQETQNYVHKICVKIQDHYSLLKYVFFM